MLKNVQVKANALVRIPDQTRRLMVAEIQDNVPNAQSLRDGIAVAVDRVDHADWNLIAYSDVAAVQCRTALGAPCKIRGHVTWMSKVEPVHFDGELVDTISLELEDSAGNAIRSATICSDDLVKRVRRLALQCQVLDFLGCTVSTPCYAESGKFKKLSYVFLLTDVQASEDVLQMVRATPAEIKETAKLVTRLSQNQGAILEHIRAELIAILRIEGLEESPQLDRALSAVVLQALSDGNDPTRGLSHRIHTLVEGSPAVGKHLLAKVIGILNPVFTTADASKMTVAGIVGRAIPKNGGWSSEAGLIPLAHRGAFVIEDYHHSDKKNALMGVFSAQMETGLVVDASAAKKTHAALTAIHLDLNRRSEIYLSESQNTSNTGNARLKDIELPTNVLSRFDFATAIPRDAARQAEIALKMHTGIQKTSRYQAVKSANVAERRLQVLVAYLRSTYAEIQIPADVTENYIRVKQKELLDQNRDQLGRLKILSDIQTRLSNSVHKFTYAIARSNARSVATKEDADEAFRYVATKLEFLASIEPFETPDGWDPEPVTKKVKDRRKFILDEFGGREVTPQDILPRLREKYGQALSVTTARRDLNAVAEKPRHGVFLVPERQNGKLKKSAGKQL